MTNLRAQRGMSLIEATVVLAVMAMLTAILAPAAAGYIDTSRQARTRQDLQAIAEAIQLFIADNGENQFLRSGHGFFSEEPPAHDDASRVDLLVSDGDIPTLGSGVSGETYWTQAVGGVGAAVDTLANHLVQNTPGDDALGDTAYRNPSHIAVGGGGGAIDFARTESGGFNAPYAWRGAYLRGPVSGDPWGNRYAVNVAFLDPSASTAVSGTITASFTAADYPRLDVFVLSAGPDEEIDTRSAQDGAVPGDDDFIYLVSSHAK